MIEGKFVAYYRVSTFGRAAPALGSTLRRRPSRTRCGAVSRRPLPATPRLRPAPPSAPDPNLPRHWPLPGDGRQADRRERLATDARPGFHGDLVAADVEVVFCDLPRVDGPVGRFMLRQMLSVANSKHGMIAERTRKGAGRGQRRGACGLVATGATSGPTARRAGSPASKFGRNRRRGAGRPQIDLGRDQGRGRRYARAVARELDARGVPAARGGRWSSSQVMRVERGAD